MKIWGSTVLTGLLACVLVAGAAAQSLGATVTATERRQLTARAGYSMQEVRAASGAAVRTYVSPAGVVFGVAWQGAAMPDMTQLLGAHFADFQAAARNHARRGPLYVKVGTLVVETSGHMRALRGRAFLTDAMPAGVTAAVVQ